MYKVEIWTRVAREFKPETLESGTQFQEEKKAIEHAKSKIRKLCNLREGEGIGTYYEEGYTSMWSNKVSTQPGDIEAYARITSV